MDWFRDLFDNSLTIWNSGGWAMWAIAGIGFIMFAQGVTVWFRLRETGHTQVGEDTWRRWIEVPSQTRGPVGDIVQGYLETNTLKEARAYFNEVRIREALPFRLDLRVMKICVSAAPLVGLLGTVTGMLSTFGALSSGSGGQKTMQLVAAGISEALITTETGLVIALPGLFFHHQLKRGFEAYRVFLAHLECVCIQTLHTKTRSSSAARRVVRKHPAASTA